jgi:hypothetical protein
MPGSFAECPAVGTSFTNRHKFGKPMSISQSAQTTGDEIETSHRTPHFQESSIPNTLSDLSTLQYCVLTMVLRLNIYFK